MKFRELPIPEPILLELDAKNYLEATPVQAAVIAELTGDLLVSSQTGSGKTLAFGIALAPLLLEDGKDTRKKGAKPRALIMSPTRELAQQVARELSWAYKKTGARVATCVGGMDIRGEQRALDMGASIVVGTPGRVIDHLDRGSLVLGELKAVVLDEADEMLDMGFRDEIEKILSSAPPDRRTLLFSATLPREIVALAKKFTKDAKRLELGTAQEPHADITYVGHLVAPREREHAVVNVLRAHDVGTALVFCATRDGVAHLHGGLVERGFRAVALSGELSQAERTRALHEVREGRARVLVCTDVAARGIDLPLAALVVHADLPNNAEVLQHRSGRTGRAGRKGTAVVLAPFNWRGQAERLFRNARVEGTWTPVPTIEDVRVADQVRLMKDIGALVVEGEGEDLEVAKALLEKFPPEQLAAALVRSERRSLPAAEELPLTTSYKAGAFERGGRAAPRDRPTRGPRADAPAADGARAERSTREGTRPLTRGPRADAPAADGARAERPTREGTRPLTRAPRADAPAADGARAERPTREGTRPLTRGPRAQVQPAHGARANVHALDDARAERSTREGTGPARGPRAAADGPPSRRPRADVDAPPVRPLKRAARVAEDSGEQGAAGVDGGVWFRVNVGRAKNADPKWLIPMLCRRGGIQKRDIGRFKIGTGSTMFELNPTKATQFETSAREPDAKDPHIKIERADSQ